MTFADKSIKNWPKIMIAEYSSVIYLAIDGGIFIFQMGYECKKYFRTIGLHFAAMTYLVYSKRFCAHACFTNWMLNDDAFGWTWSDLFLLSSTK